MIYFLSPNLGGSGIKGHYFNYLKSINNQLNKYEDIDTSVIGSIDMSEFLMSSFSNSMKHFTVNVSTKNNLHKSKHCKILISLLLVKDLFRLKQKMKAKASDNDILFCDTVTDSEIFGWFIFTLLNFLWLKRRFVKCVFILRFRPVKNSFILTAYVTLLEFMTFKVLKNLFNLNFIFYTDSELLVKDYNHLLGICPNILPIPLEKNISIYRRNISRSIDPINVLFIGGGQPFKGLDFMLSFINYYKTKNLNLNLHFFIQYEMRFDSYKLSDLEKKRQSLLVNLLQDSEVKVFLVDTNINNDRYVELFKKSHFIFIPYSSAHFKSATSNIFAESLMYGLIPIVPTNTWMSYELSKMGLGESVININDIEKSFIDFVNIVKNYENYFLKFTAQSEGFIKYHNSETFVLTLRKHIFASVQDI